MKENTQEKSLVQVNENGVIFKIKRFIKGMFHRNDIKDNFINTETIVNITEKKENIKNAFMEEIRKIEDDETILLKLQKRFRNGEIKEEDLTDEQFSSLCSLYDKQIASLRKSNEMRKQKLLEYRRKLQT